jgi:lipopolysaccharide/colanic/teichoic acid biosynthesis glycosyltransferase
MEFVFRVDRGMERARRCADVIVACAALLLALPIMIVAALAIALEDRGPILFRQRRIGRFGRPFTIYKFRSMRVDRCEDRVKPSDGTDARITRVGRFLRKTSVDELPQLFNVLLGHMAIVGPRPEMPFLVGRYEPWQHLRHLVKPGITGLWQTTCRSTLPMQHPNATKLDLEYVRRASVSTDLHIIVRTFSALISGRGAV